MTFMLHSYLLGIKMGKEFRFSRFSSASFLHPDGTRRAAPIAGCVNHKYSKCAWVKLKLRHAEEETQGHGLETCWLKSCGCWMLISQTNMLTILVNCLLTLFPHKMPCYAPWVKFRKQNPCYDWCWNSIPTSKTRTSIWQIRSKQNY